MGDHNKPASAEPPPTSPPPPDKRKYYDASILILIQFVGSYEGIIRMGFFKDVKKYFDVDDTGGQLIRVVFMLFLMTTSPVFGYVADRFSRRYLAVIGMTVWSVSRLCASLMTKFWALLVMRAFMGVGQACFTVVAPSLLGDLFVGDTRSRLLAVYYLMVPISIGTSMIVTGEVAKVTDSWRWSMRITVVMGVVSAVLAGLVLREPVRGELEGLQSEATPLKTDLKNLWENSTYVTNVLGLTTVSFFMGTLNVWILKLLCWGMKITYPNSDHPREETVLGLILCPSGCLGILGAYLLSRHFKKKYPRGDPLICSVAVLTSTPLFFIVTYLMKTDEYATYVVLFFGLFCLNMIWAVTADVCLGVVVPSRRGSAFGIMACVVHAVGDLGSPYLTTLVSNGLYYQYQHEEPHPQNEYLTLQYAGFLSLLVAVTGSVLYFMASIFIVEDLTKAQGDTTAP